MHEYWSFTHDTSSRLADQLKATRGVIQYQLLAASSMSEHGRFFDVYSGHAQMENHWSLIVSVPRRPRRTNTKADIIVWQDLNLELDMYKRQQTS